MAGACIGCFRDQDRGVRAYLLDACPCVGAGTQKKLQITGNSGSSVCFQAAYWEYLSCQAAHPYAVYTEGAEGCAVSENRYGKGKAYYVSAEANADILGWLYDEICREERLEYGIRLGEGIVARKIREREYLVVNTKQESVSVKLNGTVHCVLQGRDITDKLILEPFDGDLLVGDINSPFAILTV